MGEKNPNEQMDFIPITGACILLAICHVFFLLPDLPAWSLQPKLPAKNIAEWSAKRNNTRGGSFAGLPVLHANHGSHE